MAVRSVPAPKWAGPQKKKGHSHPEGTPWSRGREGGKGDGRRMRVRAFAWKRSANGANREARLTPAPPSLPLPLPHSSPAPPGPRHVSPAQPPTLIPPLPSPPATRLASFPSTWTRAYPPQTTKTQPKRLIAFPARRPKQSREWEAGAGKRSGVDP